MGEGNARYSPIASTSRTAKSLIPPIFPKKQRPYPAVAGARPRLPPSRRKGGSLGRRSEAAAGADGAGRDGAIRTRRPEGCNAPRPWDREQPPSDPGDGRRRPCPRRADRVTCQQQATAPARRKPAARSVCLSPKRYSNSLIRAKARALRHASHNRPGNSAAPTPAPFLDPTRRPHAQGSPTPTRPRPGPAARPARRHDRRVDEPAPPAPPGFHRKEAAGATVPARPGLPSIYLPLVRTNEHNVTPRYGRNNPLRYQKTNESGDRLDQTGSPL